MADVCGLANSHLIVHGNSKLRKMNRIMADFSLVMSLERRGCLISPEVGVVVSEGLRAESVVDVGLGGVACSEVGVVSRGELSLG